jgi:hypothetical protein
MVLAREELQACEVVSVLVVIYVRVVNDSCLSPFSAC